MSEEKSDEKTTPEAKSTAKATVKKAAKAKVSKAKKDEQPVEAAAEVKAKPEQKVEQKVEQKTEEKVAEPVAAQTDEVVEAAALMSDIELRAAAISVADRYAKWSFGVGFIPVPVFDLVALTGLQLKMLDEIAKVYGQSFYENKVRSVIASILGGAFPQSVSRVGLSSLLKSVPVLGTAVAMITMPVAAAAATYAVGVVFIKHFESGGTFLSVDISKMTAQVKKSADEYRQNKPSE